MGVLLEKYSKSVGQRACGVGAGGALNVAFGGRGALRCGHVGGNVTWRGSAAGFCFEP